MTSDFSEMKHANKNTKFHCILMTCIMQLLIGDLELYRTTLVVQKLLADSNTCQCQ